MVGTFFNNKMQRTFSLVTKLNRFLKTSVELHTGIYSNCLMQWLPQSFHFDRLVGLVVKASASRAEDPGFESRLRRDFFGVESYQ